MVDWAWYLLETAVDSLNALAMAGSISMVKSRSSVTFRFLSSIFEFTKSWKLSPIRVYSTLPMYSLGNFNVSFSVMGRAYKADPLS